MQQTIGTQAAALAVIGAATALVVLWLLAWRIGRLMTAGARAGLRRLQDVGRWQSNPVRAWLARRFPRLMGLLERRLDPGRFAGLPLTLIAAAALYLAFLFAGLIEEVLEAEGIVAVDQAIVAAVATFRHPLVVGVFIWITHLGAMPALSAVAIVATGFLWAHGPQRYIFPVWLTVLGSQATTWGGKFLVARPRPDFLLDVTAYSPSFPSGHTTGAAAVYGIIAYAISRDLQGAGARFAVAYWTLVLIALVALSRIVLSVHYPSDVAAGLLVGGFWLLAGVALAETSRAATQ